MSLVSFVKLEAHNQLRQAIRGSLELIHFDFPNNLKNIVIIGIIQQAKQRTPRFVQVKRDETRDWDEYLDELKKKGKI